MKIIISPAKKMNVRDEGLEPTGRPYYLEQAEQLMEYMKHLSYTEAKKLWNCNDKIASLNVERLLHMDLNHRLTPAILSYEGIQYQYMAPNVFSQSQLEYIEKHLLILSGFYGVLYPLDGIVPYRLEMQAKVDISIKNQHFNSLYHFWGDKIYRKVTEENQIILNLASKEYSKVIETYLSQDVTFINCIFGCIEQGQSGDERVKVKATEAKMARGEMVRYMAEREIEDPHEVIEFNNMGYRYRADLSDEKNYVFIK